MKINLREEETTNYLGFYQEYLENVQQLNRKVNDVLNEIMQESKYDKLQQRISQIIDVYTETIIGKVENGVFATWIESNGSLRSCLKTYRAGEATDEVCAQIEQTMGDLMQEVLSIEKADAIVTERPIVSEDGLEQLEDVFRRARTEIQDIKSEFVLQANSRSESNEIFGTLRPLFEGVAANLESFFEASQNSFEELHEFVRGIALQLHNIPEENGVGGNSGTGITGESGGDKSLASDVKAPVGAEDENGKIEFKGENFTEENIKLFVFVVEKIVGQVGVDELNSLVEKYYTELRDRQTVFSQKENNNTSPDPGMGSNIYGRYTVTDKSRRVMVAACSKMDSLLEPIDRFYKEKFKSLGDGFDKANTIIHNISTFCGLWGLGTWDLSKLFSPDDSDSSVLEKIQLGWQALTSGPAAAAEGILKGGASLVKILDKAIPRLKKSKILVKLSEKVWNSTRQDIQVPYMQKMMDQYMMEHYEQKYGMNKGIKNQRSYFEYLHSVAMSIEDDQQRRAFENAMFSTENLIWLYSFKETDANKYKALFYGVYLNLVRSGMCRKQDLKPSIANDIVDKLYNIYVSKEMVTPRVDASPDQGIPG